MAALSLAAAMPTRIEAQAIDPAVVGERLQRLTSIVESMELTLASQKRQIDALQQEVQNLRDLVTEQNNRRDWASDLKKLADAISEVDRKRIADNEHVVKILGELRKAVSTPAEPAKPARSRSTEIATDKALPYVFKRGDTLSGVLQSFNPDAEKKGYRPLTPQQVMDFNKIEDARRIPEGATIMLPLIPQ
jgi:ABC-type transporter Mla subunit MlaD